MKDTLSILIAIFIISVSGCLPDSEPKIGLRQKKLTTHPKTSSSLKTVKEFKNTQYTSKAKFHPEKNVFAVLVDDGTVHLLDAVTKERKTVLHKPDVFFNAFAFLYDGHSIILGSNSGKLYKADFPNSEITFLKDFGDREIARLDASKNGNIAIGLAGGYKKSKTQNLGLVYSLNDRKILSEYHAAFRENFQGIAISPKGDVLAIDEITGKQRGACLLDTSTGEEVQLCYHQKYGCGPLSVDIASDNKTMAVGYAPYHVIVWNTADASVKWLFEEHTNWVVSLDFSDDMKFLASGAGDSSARVYNLLTGRQIGHVLFKGSSTYVESVDISSDGKLLLTAVDGCVGIYEMP